MELRSSCTEAQQPCQAHSVPWTSSPCCFTPSAATRETPGDPDANVLRWSFCFARLRTYLDLDSSQVMSDGEDSVLGCLTTRLMGFVVDKCGTKHSTRLQTGKGPLTALTGTRHRQNSGNMYSSLTSNTIIQAETVANLNSSKPCPTPRGTGW